MCNFDPLADNLKIMCDHCCNKHPLSLYYFQEYKPYIMEAEVEHVQMESQANYIDLAKKAAECFKQYCEQDCKVPAAELSETTIQLCPLVPLMKLTVSLMVQLKRSLIIKSQF